MLDHTGLCRVDAQALLQRLLSLGVVPEFLLQTPHVVQCHGQKLVAGRFIHVTTADQTQPGLQGLSILPQLFKEQPPVDVSLRKVGLERYTGCIGFKRFLRALQVLQHATVIEQSEVLIFGLGVVDPKRVQIGCSPQFAQAFQVLDVPHQVKLGHEPLTHGRNQIGRFRCGTVLRSDQIGCVNSCIHEAYLC